VIVTGATGALRGRGGRPVTLVGRWPGALLRFRLLGDRGLCRREQQVVERQRQVAGLDGVGAEAARWPMILFGGFSFSFASARWRRL
jgi:hypothetical protein